MPDVSASAQQPLADQFAVCNGEAAALAELSEAQGRWRPGPERWSVAECLAHLAATAREYEPGVVVAVRRVRELGKPAPRAFRPGWFGRRIVAFMEPGAGRPVRTTAALTPPADVSLAEAVRVFEHSQAMLRGALAEVEGLDLGSARVRSPVAPVLSFSLGTAFAVLAAHERRHLAQARRVIEAPGFPVA